MKDDLPKPFTRSARPSNLTGRRLALETAAPLCLATLRSTMFAASFASKPRRGCV